MIGLFRGPFTHRVAVWLAAWFDILDSFVLIATFTAVYLNAGIWFRAMIHNRSKR